MMHDGLSNFSQVWLHVQGIWLQLASDSPLTMDQAHFDALPINQRTFVYKYGPGFRVKVDHMPCGLVTI